MKKIIFGLVSAVALVSVLTYQNCSGTRSRTGNLTVSLSVVKAQLIAFQTAAAANPNGAPEKAQIDAFINMVDSPTATLYYSVAPSSLGSIAQVLPIDFPALDSNNAIGSPSKVIGFVVVDQDSSGWRGAMIITGNLSGTGATTATTGATPDATPGATPAATPGATPNATPSPDGDLFNFNIVGINSGVSTLDLAAGGAQEAGQLDGSLRIPMIVSGGKSIVLSTDDVDSNDIVGQVVQFRILMEDPATGTEDEVGILNVVAPE